MTGAITMTSGQDGGARGGSHTRNPGGFPIFCPVIGFSAVRLLIRHGSGLACKCQEVDWGGRPRPTPALHTLGSHTATVGGAEDTRTDRAVTGRQARSQLRYPNCYHGPNPRVAERAASARPHTVARHARRRLDSGAADTQPSLRSRGRESGRNMGADVASEDERPSITRTRVDRAGPAAQPYGLPASNNQRSSSSAASVRSRLVISTAHRASNVQ